MAKEERGLDPKIAIAIETTIKRLRPEIEAGSDQSLWVVGDIAATFSREFKVNPFQHMQNVFDQERIDVKFIAIPKGSALDRYGLAKTATGVVMPSDTHRLGVSLPHDTDGDYPYYAHTIVKRIGEYYEKLTLLKVSAEENFNRLAHTGLLFQLPGSTEARITQSPNN